MKLHKKVQKTLVRTLVLLQAKFGEILHLPFFTTLFKENETKIYCGPNFLHTYRLKTRPDPLKSWERGLSNGSGLVFRR